MKKIFLAAMLLSLAAAAVAFDVPGTLRARWPVKTSLPKTAALKKAAHPGLDKLIQLGTPPTYDRSATRDKRIPGKVDGLADGQMVQTEGYVHMVARDDDGDYHIQMTESADALTPCFIVEIPKPETAYVADQSLHPKFEKARSVIRSGLLHDESKEPGKGGHVMNTAPKMRVTGQLFYDDEHTGAGRKGKLGCKELPSWEIHPVTSLAFVEPKKGH